MTIHESQSGSRSPAGQPEYTAELSSRVSRGSVVSSRRTRMLYFGASASWGFFVGVGGLLVALGIGGNPATTNTTSILALTPAAAIAIAGAGILAGAYQEAKRRRR